MAVGMCQMGGQMQAKIKIQGGVLLQDFHIDMSLFCFYMTYFFYLYLTLKDFIARGEILQSRVEL